MLLFDMIKEIMSSFKSFNFLDKFSTIMVDYYYDYNQIGWNYKTTPKPHEMTPIQQETN